MPGLDPIILVGMQRSGTTWLGSLLGRHPDVAYWVEPRHVWIWGHWFRPDDRLTAGDATPRIQRHIRRTFAEYAERQGRPRFAEKTPSNVLRIPFIREVFPEARIVLLVRDGRSVLRSSQEMGAKGPDWGRLRTRALETPLHEWPAYLSRLPWLVDKLRGRPIKMWGVRPPGWRTWDRDSPRVIVAKQWAASIRCAVEDGRAAPDPSRYLEVRYEDLTARPTEIVQRIVDFLALPAAGDLVREAASTADASRQDKWRKELDADVLAEIRPHMEPTLDWLGYSW